MLLGYIVAIACASPRNSTWFTRPYKGGIWGRDYQTSSLFVSWVVSGHETTPLVGRKSNLLSTYFIFCFLFFNIPPPSTTHTQCRFMPQCICLLNLLLAISLLYIILCGLWATTVFFDAVLPALPDEKEP